jgi:hypothetical protein
MRKIEIGVPGARVLRKARISSRTNGASAKERLSRTMTTLGVSAEIGGCVAKVLGGRGDSGAEAGAMSEPSCSVRLRICC